MWAYKVPDFRLPIGLCSNCQAMSELEVTATAGLLATMYYMASLATFLATVKAVVDNGRLSGRLVAADLPR